MMICNLCMLAMFSFISDIYYLDVGHIAEHREDDKASNEACERVDWAGILFI